MPYALFSDDAKLSKVCRQDPQEDPAKDQAEAEREAQLDFLRDS
jgi:hypothetical protein